MISTAGATSESYTVGDTVRVYYDVAHPERATLATFSDMWIGPTVLGAVGFFLLCLAVPTLIFTRRAC